VERTADEEERDPWFEETRTWSRVKLRILSKYVDAYKNKRGSSNPEFYYVDGFAGPGYYTKPGKPREAGSPVLLARLAQEINDSGKPYRLICINTELQRGRCNRLREALAEFSPELVHVFCGEFGDHIGEIIAMMGNAPAICFLDPFGAKGISPREIQPLLRRPDTELLINFNTRALHRLKGSATSSAREALGKVHRLSDILNEDPRDPVPEWLHQLNHLSSEEWERWVVDQYMSLLLGPTTHLKHAVAYPVREKHKSGARYYLVFASRSMHAFPIMSDIICTEEDDLRLKDELAARPPGQQPLFGPVHESERADRLREVIEEIHQYGLTHQRCTRERIIQHFSFLYFGEFKQKHVRALVGELVRQGRAEIADDKSKTLDRRPIRFK
jgi:three-Cys-motif partner protein